MSFLRGHIHTDITNDIFLKREQYIHLLMKYLIFINEYYLFKLKVGFEIAGMQCV